MVAAGASGFYLRDREMKIARLLIRAYQVLVSPILSFLGGPGSGCRFEPTCSHYMLQAIESHGLLRGGWLGARRLCRCHPWGGAGCDPVPPPAVIVGRPRNLETHS